MFRITNELGSLIFRDHETMIRYVKEHKGEKFTIEWITEYTLGDPMEQ
jgi:uncharacterized protein with von Willebrand factor type A (vWA) domain